MSIFIGIPFLNRPDLLGEALATMKLGSEKIHLYVVNNNTVDTKINEDLGAVAEEHGVDMFSPRYNLGVAASWNRIVMRGIGLGHDYIYVGSNDTMLGEGALQAFVDMPKAETSCLWLLNHFNFFCLHRRFISRVGWFDENFYPAYFEDNDFVYRCKLAGLDVTHAPEELTARTDHKGSQTIKSDPKYAAGNNSTFGSWNATHFRMKWGGNPGRETFKTPYGEEEKDIRWWPDPGGSISHRDWDKGRERIR